MGEQPAGKILLADSCWPEADLKAELETCRSLSTAIALVLEQIPEAAS